MKTAYIMRGLPGSGKSTVAQEIARGNFHEICSTDDQCMVDGEYRWEASKVAERHAANREKFEQACGRGTPVVICDNTNTQFREFEPYARIAESHGYAVVFVEMTHPSVGECVERNKHSVPRETIERMIDRWETQ